MSVYGPPRRESGRWVVSRYRDVEAALRDPRLSAVTTGTAPADPKAHVAARQAAMALAGRARLDELRPRFEALADAGAGALPEGEIDLVAAYARPFCAELAVAITGAAPEEVPALLAASRVLFASAADPDDEALRLEANHAVLALATGLGRALDVQTFVALAETMPCFLAGAWTWLYRTPALWEHLAADPAALPGVVEELLRVAGPARAQLRRATSDVELGGVDIPTGDRLVLRLDHANRDPDAFPEPDRVELAGRGVQHLAFGMGPHTCAGMAVVRLAAVTATRPLLRHFAKARWIDDPGVQGGWAIGGPARVRVIAWRSAPPG